MLLVKPTSRFSTGESTWTVDMPGVLPTKPDYELGQLKAAICFRRF